MAFNVYGADGTMSEVPWARMFSLGFDDIISSAVVSARPASTRTVDIAAGFGIVGGAAWESTAASTLALNANTAGNPRIDLVCAQIDWSGTGATASVVAVQGSAAATPSAPYANLVQTAGTKWQTPLAEVTLAAGVGQLLAGAVVDVRPGRRTLLVSRNAATAGQSMGPGVTTPSNIATINTVDPGWRVGHRLRVVAAQKFTALTGPGFGRIDVTIDGTSVAESRAPKANDGVAHLYYVSNVMTGAHQVRLRMVPQAMSGENLVTEAAYAQFTVEIQSA